MFRTQNKSSSARVHLYYSQVVNIYPSGLGVSIHNKSSLGRVHLYYCLSDKYVINVAYMFQVITSLHQLEYSFIIA